MWWLILAYAASATTILWYSRAENDVYLFKILALIQWGAAIMGFVDSLVSYFEGEPLLEVTEESVLLGLVLLLASILLWELVLFIKDPRRVLYKK